MTEYQKPLPVVNEDTRGYWEGCQKHELLVQQCTACGHFQFYPRALCTECLSEDLAWAKSSGQAKVYSFTVVHRAPSKAFAPDAPYVIGVVELSEGVRMMTNIVGCEPDAVKIGMPVEVVFDDVTPEVTLPKFRPAGVELGGSR